jgi:hypothetical protein
MAALKTHSRARGMLGLEAPEQVGQLYIGGGRVLAEILQRGPQAADGGRGEPLGVFQPGVVG